MRKQLVCLTIIAFSVSGFISESPAFAAEKAREGVRTAVEQFYSALNVMFTGELQPMKEVWSHKDDELICALEVAFVWVGRPYWPTGRNKPP
jgi:hypothetical protein